MSKKDKIIVGTLYWIWQLTWGGLTTIVGLLVTTFCILFLKGKPHRNGFSYIVEVGGNWGGLELGAVALCGSYNTRNSGCYNPKWFEHTRRHEFGHSLQNLIFGPFTLFVVDIPSACRYWYQRIMGKKGKKFAADWYDSAWFEGTATRWGTRAVDFIESPCTDEDLIPEIKPITPSKPVIVPPVIVPDSSVEECPQPNIKDFESTY